MSGISLTFLLALLAITVRMALHFSGVVMAPFDFALAHLLFIVVATWFSGHFLLRRDPSRGFGELMRAGFQSAMLYAALLAIFTWFFYKWIEPDAFSAYNERLVQGFIAQGHPAAEARRKVEGLYNGLNYSVLSFFGLLMAGALNTVVFALVHHKLLRRFRGSGQ
ncbi:MAG: DUF4199 family protein [Bacteroidetes bacterium]|nr:DUF4199 family protein [Bacteroidota bacterium]MBS1943508.1 DUF4199 family protein [Bacteroidota bacterium]